MGTLQEIEDEKLANRSKVEVQVGDFILKLEPRYMHFRAHHRFGKAVPKGLQGIWTEVYQFRQAAEKILGQEYSIEGLKGRDERLAQAAREAGISPDFVKLGGSNG